MQPLEPPPKSSLLKKIKRKSNSEVLNIAVPIGDFISGTLLGGFPAFSLVSGGIRYVSSLSDRILYSQIERFATRLNEIPIHEQENFSRKLKEDPDFAERAGEQILLYLTKFNDIDKPDLLALVFSAWVIRKIDWEDVKRIADGIDKAFFVDLVALVDSENSRGIENQKLYKKLFQAGFTEIEEQAFVSNPDKDLSSKPFISRTPPRVPSAFPRNHERQDRATIRYRLSELGELFLKIVREA